MGAQGRCGNLYNFGHGVAQDDRLAFLYYEKGAQQGDAGCQSGLGAFYIHGLGVAKDYLEARRLYTLASAQGFAQATEELNRLEEKIRTECPLLGKRVMITGTSREDLNGRAGVARSFDEAKGRYVVRLDGAGAGESALRLKPVNLRPTVRLK